MIKCEYCGNDNNERETHCGLCRRSLAEKCPQPTFKPKEIVKRKSGFPFGEMQLMSNQAIYEQQHKKQIQTNNP